MPRGVVVAGLTLLLAFVCPQRAAAADLWAWIKALSGPGPFRGAQFDVRLVCLGGAVNSVKLQGEELDRLRDTLNGKRLVPTAVTVSLCPVKTRLAPFAIGTVVRFMSYTDKSETNAYAGGNKIGLQTWSGTFTWRPLNGITHQNLDFIDIGAGVGWYRFTSADVKPGGFSDIKGLLLEPVRLELHLPSRLRSQIKWVWVPFLQWNYVVFANGFDPNAFGPDLVGAKAAAIPKDEWIRNIEFFWDLTPLIDLLKK